MNTSIFPITPAAHAPRKGGAWRLALGAWVAALGLWADVSGAPALRGGAPAPPYRIERRAGGFRLVAPDGTPFFSLGVCCVGMGTPREEYDAAKPGYAAWRQYNSPTAWADATLRRLRSWGFTTIGGWSDIPALARSRRMDLPFTPVLHLGSTAGAPWFDMWDPKVIGRMEEVARAQILPVRDDPRLLGYYSDNEMGWWSVSLFKMTLEHPPQSGQRQQLMKLLRDRYRGGWSRLLADFEPERAGSFADLEKGGVLYLRPGGDGLKMVRRFLGLAATRYYQLVRQTIRKYDRRALILGDRYQSFYYPEVPRAASGQVDAISSNLNATWNDGAFPRFYLDTLHTLTGKPVLVTEFYMSARENRSGNTNDSSGFPVVATQKERAQGFRNTLTALRRLPYVLGADWFQYTDEPTFGRGDGENYNFGLVDINDRPYEELTAAATEGSAWRLALGASLGMGTSAPLPSQPSAKRQAPSAAFHGVPRANGDPTAAFEPWLALKSWDRERGFVPPASRDPVADLYLCWSPGALYLGLVAMDVVEEDAYKDRQVPEVDRAEWVIRLPGQRAPLQIRVGAGRPPNVSDKGINVVSLSGVTHDTRVIAVIKLPAATLGKGSLQPGDRVRFSSTLTTHGRTYRVSWNGSFTLSKDEGLP